MLGLLRKIQFIFTLSLAIICSLVYISYESLNDLKTNSLEKDIYHDFYKLSQNRDYDANRLKQLQDLRALTKIEARKSLMANYIYAYNTKNTQAMHLRFKEWTTFENNHIANLNQQKETAEKHVFYSLIAALFLAFTNMFYVTKFFHQQILTPVQNLSRRINDFMDGYYTYHFNDAPDNEIGNLDRSFQFMAEKVIKNMEELKELDEAKSEFMSIVSHELRTPMTSIKGSLNLISSERLAPLPDKIKKLIRIAEDESNRLIRLINDLLDLAKIEAKSYKLNSKWHDLDQLIWQAKDSLEGFLIEAKVKIEYDSNIEKLEIYADQDKLKQVIVNLLSNAIKYSPEGATVTISTHLNNAKLYIQVQDQGPGIEPQQIEYIFQKFRQANSPDRPLVKGTGLGLSIAKSLVEAHGGEIGVRSNFGHGCVFFFTLTDFRKLESRDKEQVA